MPGHEFKQLQTPRRWGFWANQQRLGHGDGSPITESVYTRVISEDGKRVAAQLGDAVWGVLDASWTEKENLSEVEASKPLYLQ
jgi:hypothetical protein